jgi:hypothetical protein
MSGKPDHPHCFRALYFARRKGEIELEEYLAHITAHYSDVRHPEDAQSSWFQRFSFEDEVKELLVHGDTAPLDDESTY